MIWSNYQGFQWKKRWQLGQQRCCLAHIFKPWGVAGPDRILQWYALASRGASHDGSLWLYESLPLRWWQLSRDDLRSETEDVNVSRPPQGAASPLPVGHFWCQLNPIEQCSTPFKMVKVPFGRWKGAIIHRDHHPISCGLLPSSGGKLIQKTNQYNETAVLNTAQVNIYSTSQLGPFHHLFFGWWFQSWIWLFSFADPGCLGWEEFETTSQIQSQRFEMLMQAVILRKLVIRYCNWLWVKHGAIILQLLLFIQFYSLQRFLETFDHSFDPIFVVPLVPLFDGTNLTHTHCFCCKKDRARWRKNILMAVKWKWSIRTARRKHTV